MGDQRPQSSYQALETTLETTMNPTIKSVRSGNESSHVQDVSKIEKLLTLLHVKIGEEDPTAERVGENSPVFTTIYVDKQYYTILYRIFDIFEQVKKDLLDSGEFAIYAQTIATSNIMSDASSLCKREHKTRSSTYAKIARLFIRDVGMDVMQFMFKIFAVTYVVTNVYQLRRNPTEAIKKLMKQWKTILNVMVSIPSFFMRFQSIASFVMFFLKFRGFWSYDLEKIKEQLEKFTQGDARKVGNVGSDQSDTEKLESIATSQQTIVKKFDELSEKVTESLQDPKDLSLMMQLLDVMRPIVQHAGPVLMATAYAALQRASRGVLQGQSALGLGSAFQFGSEHASENACSIDDMLFTVVAELSDVSLKTVFQRAFTPSDHEDFSYDVRRCGEHAYVSRAPSPRAENFLAALDGWNAFTTKKGHTRSHVKREHISEHFAYDELRTVGDGCVDANDLMGAMRKAVPNFALSYTSDHPNLKTRSACDLLRFMGPMGVRAVECDDPEEKARVLDACEGAFAPILGNICAAWDGMRFTNPKHGRKDMRAHSGHDASHFVWYVFRGDGANGFEAVVPVLRHHPSLTTIVTEAELRDGDHMSNRQSRIVAEYESGVGRVVYVE